ncbi:hypothetical protein JKP88DRAFT_351415 [Tribonema minus]|uniref:FAD/NAD(P)-binding domain-containing protein n=1 Tax=Tribonema minus TaxID=303371 RepID=A0A836C802_9STRA|nr:hypothetical protein JKP88DRAFT_351415 [Tribonema minus]
MEALFKERQDAIAAAERILIIGGGPVGMETAGEIAAHYGTTKQVTLVAAKGLMEDPNTPFSDKFKTAIKSKLESVGVTVAVNAGHVDLSQATTNDAGLIVGPATYKWQSGEGEFDLAIPCIGSRIVPPLIAASGWEDKLDGGSLKVNSNLQVDGCDGSVFALGDIAALKETKLAYYAGIQAALTAQNIKAAEAGKPLKAYTLHTQATSMVPVGPNLGAAEMSGMLMGNFPVKMLKGKALFVPPTWAGVGASAALAALK